jgi:hypothetical protein
MGRLNWFERFRLTVRYSICELRKHPEDPKNKGFCRCGEYQPNQAGVPMQWIGEWSTEEAEEPT